MAPYGPLRLDVLSLAQHERFAVNETSEAWNEQNANGDGDRQNIPACEGNYQNGEQNRRKRQHEVDETHGRHFDPTAKIRRDDADHHAEKASDGDADESDRNAEPGSRCE